MEIHGKMAVLVHRDSPAGTERRPTGSGTCSHIVELSYAGVTQAGGQRTRVWQKQNQQDACNNKRMMSSSGEGDKSDNGATL